MALRWRIRHKLMLGLTLVVGIMALLLLGTFRGLLAYYLTTCNIRVKLNELKVAEDFKEEVARLVARDALAKLIARPADIDEKAADAEKKLDEYQRLLSDYITQRPETGPGGHELELCGVLKMNLDAFKSTIAKGLAPHVSGPADGNPERELDNQGKKEDPFVLLPEERERLTCFLVGVFGEAVAPPECRLPRVFGPLAARLNFEDAGRHDLRNLLHIVEDLSRNAGDLRNNIYGELDTHLLETRRHYQISLWIVVLSSIVGLLLVAGLLRSFNAWILSPIRDLECGVNRVARGDFDHRIEVHSGDEMEDLGAAFNDMMRRLQDLYSDLARQVNERSRQLVRSERLASVGFLAAGVAHEINNPLASIAFCSEALEARLAALLRQAPHAGRGGDDREVFAKYLKMIQEEAFRCKHITERLLDFSRGGERRRESTDLGQLVQSVLDITQHLQNCRGKHITFEKGPGPPAGADRSAGRIIAPVNAEEIKSVVLNLVVNALDSMDDGGRLTIHLMQRDGMAEIRFSDTGCGMSQEVLENIFEPFFTRSRTGKGTGLGLTISHRIISQHGGEIEAASPGPNKGSTFTVRLPLQSEETPGSGPPAAEHGRSPERVPPGPGKKRGMAA